MTGQNVLIPQTFHTFKILPQDPGFWDPNVLWNLNVSANHWNWNNFQSFNSFNFPSPLFFFEKLILMMLWGCLYLRMGCKRMIRICINTFSVFQLLEKVSWIKCNLGFRINSNCSLLLVKWYHITYIKNTLTAYSLSPPAQ